MRRVIMSLLLASVAASPVMAFDRSDREERRARASEEREERKQEREDRRSEPRAEHQRARQEQPAVQVEQNRPDRPDRVRERSGQAPAAVEQHGDQRRFDREQFERQRADRQQQMEGQRQDRRQIERQSFERRGDSRLGERAGRDARDRVDARRQQWDQQRAERLARQQEIRNRRPPSISPTPRPGTQPPPPPVAARPVTNPPVQWSTSHWRKDRRYDWYKHRNKYWWLFQLGWYSDPFGWGYQPYGIGWRMWPSYYSSHYWLNDPWQYRLPYAPPGTRWIRYWDDAILVDLWSGQVLDVEYNFFW